MKILLIILLSSIVYGQGKEVVLLKLIKDYWEKKNKSDLEVIYLDAINYVLNGSDGNLSIECDSLGHFRADGIPQNEGQAIIPTRERRLLKPQ